MSSEAVGQASQIFLFGRPAGKYLRFWGTAVLCNLAILFVSGLISDSGTVTLAFLLSPVIAFAFNLVYRPLIKGLSSPTDVIIKEAERVAKALPQWEILSSSSSKASLTQILRNKVRPLVNEQFEEFWADRAREPRNDEMEEKEVLAVSLIILWVTYLSVGLLAALLNMPQLEYYSRYNFPFSGIPFYLWTGWVVLFVGLVFLVASASELRSYKFMLRTRLPLLSASGAARDAAYWKGLTDFVGGRRKTITREAADQATAVALHRLARAERQEIERDYMEDILAKEAGIDEGVFRITLRAATSVDEESAAVPLLPRSELVAALLTLSVILATAVRFFTFAAATFQLFLVFTVFLLILYVFGGLLSYRLRQARKIDKELQTLLPKVSHIRKQMDELYAPLQDGAAELIESGEPSLSAFVARVDREMASHSELALERTLMAYRRGDGVRGITWARKLAEVLVEDYRALLEQYRNLTQGKPTNRLSESNQGGGDLSESNQGGGDSTSMSPGPKRTEP